MFTLSLSVFIKFVVCYIKRIILVDIDNNDTKICNNQNKILLLSALFYKFILYNIVNANSNYYLIIKLYKIVLYLLKYIMPIKSTLKVAINKSNQPQKP